MSSDAMDMPLGRNSSIHINKITCKARVPGNRQSLSTGKPKVANTEMVMDQHPGQSHQRRYYSSAEAHTVAALRVMLPAPINCAAIPFT